MQINWGNMKDDASTRYQFRKCVGCSNQSLAYDFDSLMHYTNDAFAKKEPPGLKTIQVIGDPDRVLAHSSSKHTFSPLDLVGILDMYDCKGKNSFQSFNMKNRKYLFSLMLLFNSFDLLQLCLAGHCYDNKKNDDETGIDCGGSCRPCKGLV